MAHKKKKTTQVKTDKGTLATWMRLLGIEAGETMRAGNAKAAKGQDSHKKPKKKKKN